MRGNKEENMASTRDIKRRKASVTSTGQITKAMKLVSTVKLQKAKSRAEEAKPYFSNLYQTITSMLARSDQDVKEKYRSGNPEGKTAVIVITSNRGLAGGYNQNVIKLVTEAKLDPKNTWIYALGRKGAEGLAKKGFEIKKDLSDVINAPLYSDAMAISKELMAAYEAGEIKEIKVAFTIFRNTVSHIPTMLRLLPTDEFVDDGDVDLLMNFEPSPDEALARIMPKYVTGEIFGAIMESVASENGARMQAMDNATNNAEEMVSKLELAYNRARQGAITQELTEIIAGANAIN